MPHPRHPRVAPVTSAARSTPTHPQEIHIASESGPHVTSQCSSVKKRGAHRWVCALLCLWCPGPQCHTPTRPHARHPVSPGAHRHLPTPPVLEHAAVEVRGQGTKSWTSRCTQTAAARCSTGPGNLAAAPRRAAPDVFRISRPHFARRIAGALPSVRRPLRGPVQCGSPLPPLRPKDAC